MTANTEQFYVTVKNYNASNRILTLEGFTDSSRELNFTKVMNFQLPATETKTVEELVPLFAKGLYIEFNREYANKLAVANIVNTTVSFDPSTF
jgi:hypothetical protein